MHIFNIKNVKNSTCMVGLDPGDIEPAPAEPGAQVVLNLHVAV